MLSQQRELGLGAAGEGLQVDLEQAACLAAGEGNLHVTPAPERNRHGCRIEHLASGHVALPCRGISAPERSGLAPERNAAPVDRPGPWTCSTPSVHGPRPFR